MAEPTTKRMMDLSEKIADLFTAENATREEGITALMWTLAGSVALEAYKAHAKGSKVTLTDMVVPIADGILAFGHVLYDDMIEKGVPHIDQT